MPRSGTRNSKQVSVENGVTITSGDVTATNAGDVAHDSADSGNPIKIGMKAVAHGTNPTGVTAGDRTNWYANRAGIPFVIAGHPNIITLGMNTASAQTDVSLVTVGAGVKIVVTRVQVAVQSTTAVPVACAIGFGTANVPTTTGVLFWHPGIIAGACFDTGSGAGILGVGADNEDLRITNTVATTGSISVVVSFYTIES